MATFRIVMVAVITTAALAVVASMFIHKFVAPEATPVTHEPAIRAI